jgi:hypothetical protein
MQSRGSGVFPNELFIALPFYPDIVLTVGRRSFNVLPNWGSLPERGLANPSG